MAETTEQSFDLNAQMNDAIYINGYVATIRRLEGESAGLRSALTQESAARASAEAERDLWNRSWISADDEVMSLRASLASAESERDAWKLAAARVSLAAGDVSTPATFEASQSTTAVSLFERNWSLRADLERVTRAAHAVCDSAEPADEAEWLYIRAATRDALADALLARLSSGARDE